MNSDQVYNRLFDMKRASGINAKKALMVNDELFKQILEYCYNPFRTYYLTVVHQLGKGTNFIDESTFRLLDQLAERQLSGSAAIMAMKMHMRKLTRKSAFLVNRILSKDMKIGVGTKTINAVFPGLIPEHKIMRAKLFEDRRFRPPMWSSPKINGLRAIYRNKTFYMRGGKPYHGMEHLIENLGDIAFDGELIIPGWEFNDMSGQLRSDDRSPLAHYYIWDMPDSKMPFNRRYQQLEEMFLAAPVTGIHLVEHDIVHTLKEVYTYYNNYRTRGFEGSVIKTFNYKYKDNRSCDWMKVKDLIGEDLEVVGIYEGKGKYKGMLGGVYVNRNGKTDCKVGGGWSDIERKLYYEHPEYIIGNIIEVIFQEPTKTGNMRHARKTAVRDDLQ